MPKGLSTRPGDYELAYQYFESYSPLPGDLCRKAFASLPEREQLFWWRRAIRATSQKEA